MASNLRVDQIIASTSDSVSIGTATFTGGLSGDITGLSVSGVITATTLNQDVSGGINVTGVVTATTLDAATSITVGESFLKNNQIGIGSTTTAGRNAGVGTAIGAIIHDADTRQVQIYDGTAWRKIANIGGWSVASPVTPSGPGQAGVVEYSSGTTTYVVFYDPGTLTLEGDVEAQGALLVGGGGTGGAPGGGGGGAGGLLETDSPFTLQAGTYNIQVGDGAPPIRSNSPANPEGPSGGNIPWLNPTGPIWPGGDTLGTPGQPTYLGSHVAYGGENGGASAQLPAYPLVSGYPGPSPSKVFSGKPYIPWSPNTSVGSGGAISYPSGDPPNLPESTFQQPSPLFTGYGNPSGQPSPENGGSGGAGGAGTPGSSGGGGGAERVVPSTLLPDGFTGDTSSFPSVFLGVPTPSPSAQRRAFAGGAAAYLNRPASPYGTGGSGGPSGTQLDHSGTNFRGGGGGGMNTSNPGTTYGYGGKGVVIIKLATEDRKG